MKVFLQKMPYKDIEKRREYNKIWARKKKEKTGKWPEPKVGHSEWERAYRQKNPAKHLHRLAKSRSKKNHLEFTICPDDIHIPYLCPVLNIPLYLSNGYSRENSPSIDRIDNSKGYTKDNIQIISFKANRMKSDFTITELKQLVYFLEKFN